MIRLTAIILSTIILSGCAMFDRDRKPKRDFPAWCKNEFHGALNTAREAIESKGTKLKEHDVRGEVIPGQKRFRDGWGWYQTEPSWPGGGMWVGGLTWSGGYLVQLVIDPNRPTDPSALHMGSMIHEMGHHWLDSNGHGSGHPALYDDVLPGWKEARKKVGY